MIRGNRLAYEWYPRWSGPNTRHGLGAMAKATTGELALLVEASDRRVAYEDFAAQYIPPWRNDSLRSKIRLEDLAAHQSGLATEDFGTPQGGWQQPYFKHPEWRFRIALGDVPIVYPPGTRYNYAGSGYYVLAYALTAALHNAPYHDIPTLLRERIMRPMGVPDADWQLSYGQSYPMDGMTLYAMGSGASYTARAAARVGQLILDHGRWGTQQLLDSALVAWSIRPATVPLPADEGGYRRPPSTQGGGWSVNARASWPEVPRDAIAGMGTGHEIILVVPSLDLVMVRMGKALSSDADFGPVLRDRLFAPLMRA
ncbi:MAG TPA: serine hydrolase, partial [Gemmatimonadales bacterium]|nr:serine hydrolase [Gemmatimonadales bacterium]